MTEKDRERQKGSESEKCKQKRGIEILYFFRCIKNFKYVSNKKRFNTRGTLKSIRISRLAKIPTLYRLAEILELRKGLIV